MATHISRNTEETLALGRDFGRRAEPGWIIGLKGDLGAGKTQFAKGLAAGLDCHARVHSPTFALINQYTGGRLPLYHLDLYRLESAAAIDSAGLEDYFSQRDGVTVIEWFERLEAIGRADIAHHVLRFAVAGDQLRMIHDETAGA